jgi:hypothetical protein
MTGDILVSRKQLRSRKTKRKQNKTKISGGGSCAHSCACGGYALLEA